MGELDEWDEWDLQCMCVQLCTCDMCAASAGGSPPCVVMLRWWSGGAAASCGGGLPEKLPEMQFLHFPSFLRFFKASNGNVFRR